MNVAGQTSSQAQIGFRPESASTSQPANIFNGGGQASAQSGVHSGQSQSQIQGNFKWVHSFQCIYLGLYNLIIFMIFLDTAFHIMVPHKQLQELESKSTHTEKRVKNSSNRLDNSHDQIVMQSQVHLYRILLI